MQSLALVGERVGDPLHLIYDALFKAHPDLEPLFAIDPDYAVRGSMLFHAFDCINDYFGARRIAFSFISSSRIVHRDYGVPEAQFDIFFTVMRDVFRDVLGADWTDAMTDEWDKMLADFAAAR
mgnify:CR=1 FL=1